MINWIKKLFNKKELISPQERERLGRLPKDQAAREFGVLLYELCVKQAGTFVNWELNRKDSPFKGMSAAIMLHEMLSVTFWLMKTQIIGNDQNLMDVIHDQYFRSFSSTDASSEERQEMLAHKYKQYDGEWDTISEHQDEFGLCVVQIMFGKDPDVQMREKLFWVIHYSHEALDAFVSLKKVWKKLKQPS